MKLLKLFFLVFPLLISSSLYANGRVDIDEDITNPGTGTFPLSDNYSQPQQEMESEEQLEMEREEENVDAFDEDNYNYNSDPEIYNRDEEE